MLDQKLGLCFVSSEHCVLEWDHPVPSLFGDLMMYIPPGSQDQVTVRFLTLLPTCSSAPTILAGPALHRWGTEGLGLNFPSVRWFTKGEFFEDSKPKGAS